MDLCSSAQDSQWKPVVSRAGDRGGPLVREDLATCGSVGGTAAVLVVLPGSVTDRQHGLPTPRVKV
eukprot:4231876-Amphidinium_carterae.1